MRELIKRVRFIEELDIDLLKRNDVGIEIQDFTEPNLEESEKIKIVGKYKNELKNFNKIISMHGPFLDLHPGSPDYLIREVSQKRYIETLNFANELNVEYVVFHSQINPRMNKKVICDWMNQQNKEAFELILEKSGYKGKIVIENIFETDPRMLLNMVEWIDNDQIGINLDIGHSKLTDPTLDEWIYTLKNYLIYMHVHSNDGVYDTHQAPSKEEVEQLYNILDKHKINPKICLEYNTDDLALELRKFRK